MAVLTLPWLREEEAMSKVRLSWKRRRRGRGVLDVSYDAQVAGV